jgi:hypothetical protein
MKVRWLAVLATPAIAQWTYFDDGASSIDFAPATAWAHQQNQSPVRNLYQGTQSYSNNTAAAFAFNFTGTQFALCGRTGPDAGSYIVSMRVTGSSMGVWLTLGQ